MAYKIYVCVILYVDESGKIYPQSLFFDGREYRIDGLTDIRTSPPKEVGGLLTKRFDCIIRGKVRSLYKEGDRWFVEVLSKEKNE